MSLRYTGARIPSETDPVTQTRCPWSLGVDDAYQRYHDEEWGVPVRDDAKHFEFLLLESAQAGLSWATVLRKREGYRRAFANFDAERVARFNSRSIERLVNDARIIRNRQKIAAAINNAREFLKIQEEFGSFDQYVWGFVGGQPIRNRFKEQSDIPATSAESDALSKDLKSRGFSFVGSTIIYAHMQATGLVNDHIVDCFRYDACLKLAGSGR
ncbi:MAG: DNA-3-methyladenine glycosylase I [Gammaproteobacteria bacterium]|nr:DNA-3-methyladenine glycosylase I [Gammaproteobacteria bacterium]